MSEEHGATRRGRKGRHRLQRPARREARAGADRGRPTSLVELRQAERQVRANEERLRLALRAAHMAAWEWEVGSDVVRVNGPLNGAVTDPVAVLLPSQLSEIYPDDRTHVAAAHREALAGAGRYEVEFRTVARDGTVRWRAELAEVVERDAANRPVRVLGVVMDVTARKLAEAEVRFQAELLDHTVAAVVATDPTGRVTHWNGHAEVLFGWPRAAALGQPLAELLPDPVALDEAGGAPRRLGTGAHWEGDVLCRRKDGGLVPVRLKEAPIADASGERAGIVVVAVDIAQQRHLQEELAYQASHDPLTGLPNRSLFLTRLERALARPGARDGAVAVLFLDLDRFKAVNSRFGHAIGDRLLVAVGQRLQDALGAAGLIARFGGDEFAVLLEGLTDEAEATAAAARLIAALRAPFADAGMTARVGASIGIAFTGPRLDRPAELLRAADRALYAAKRAGRGRFAVAAAEPEGGEDG